MSKLLTMSSSSYQMSDTSACGAVPTSGLPIMPVPRKKIHCILPSSPWLADSKTNIPLGVLYIAGLLREAGHDVVVTSMLDKRYEGNIHLTDSVMDSDVHMFGFCTPQFGEALELAAYIRDRVPTALLVAGGPHPSYEPVETKEAGRQETYHVKGALARRRGYQSYDGSAPLFDTVIVMEGERVTLQMLSDWHQGKLQPYYYGDKADAMDLDAIPFPAWDLLPDDHIYNDGVAVMKKPYIESSIVPGKFPVMSMIGTRGCPYKCFVAGTPVLLASGVQSPVETLHIGDMVQGFEAKTGTFLPQRVIGVGQREANNVYEAEFSNGTVIRATGDHPFWTLEGWRELRDLEHRTVRALSSVRRTEQPLRHNLREEGLYRRDNSSREKRQAESDEATRSRSASFGYSTSVTFSGTVETDDRAAQSGEDTISRRIGSSSTPGSFRTNEAEQSHETPRRGRPSVNFSQKVSSTWARLASRSRLSKLGRVTGRRAFSTIRSTLKGLWRPTVLDRTVRFWEETKSRLRQYTPSSSSPLQRVLLASGRGDSGTAVGLPLERLASSESLGGLRILPGEDPGSGLEVSSDWVTLTKLTFVGNDVVYPITVEGTHTFIAAGLVTHNCTYCSTPWIGQKPRYRSPMNIIAEMRAVMDKGVHMFKFQDDTYTLHKTKLRELALAIDAELGANSFASRIHTRVNTMDDHVAESLKLMNCKVTCFGIESGSQRVLDANQKGTKVHQNTDAIKRAKDHGFYTIAFLVSGLAGETLETAEETRQWLLSVKGYLDSCNLAVGIPYPGSRFWTHPQESGIDIVDYNYDNQWIVGFSDRDEILVRPHGATIEDMFRIKNEMFHFLVEHGWAKAEWQEDVRIRKQQEEAARAGVLSSPAVSTLTYAGH